MLLHLHLSLSHPPLFLTSGPYCQSTKGFTFYPSICRLLTKRYHIHINTNDLHKTHFKFLKLAASNLLFITELNSLIALAVHCRSTKTKLYVAFLMDVFLARVSVYSSILKQILALFDPDQRGSLIFETIKGRPLLISKDDKKKQFNQKNKEISLALVFGKARVNKYYELPAWQGVW